MALKKAIRLEKWKTVKDGNGNNTESIEKKIDYWAIVSEASGDRSSLNGQTGLTNSVSFEIDYNPKFNPTGNWRVIFDGRRFTVHQVKKKNQDRFKLIITAEAIGKR
jgi:SPP1 family predicted phage head-tail adaptor